MTISALQRGVAFAFKKKAMTREKSEIRFFHLPDVFDCRLAHGQRVTHHFPRHIHRALSFGLIERGARVIDIGGEALTVGAGECFVINPGEPHCCDADAPHDYWALALSAASLRKMLALPELPRFAPPVLRDEIFSQKFAAFIEQAEGNDDIFQSQSLLIDLVNYALAHFAVTSSEPPRLEAAHSEVRRVRQYLESHFDEPVRLDALAALAKLSPCYLNRIFQAEIGVPPYEYLVKIRLSHAQEMLSGGASISDAAHESGFADQSHFTRFFKRHVGLTPGEFLQLHADENFRRGV